MARLPGRSRMIAAVFGLVDNPTVRVYGYRFVIEAAHRLQRHRRHQAHSGGGGDLEIVTVNLFKRADRSLETLLTGYPTVPRCWPPGAITHRTRKAQIMALQQGGIRVIYERRCSTKCRSRAISSVVEQFLVNLTEQLFLTPNALEPLAVFSWLRMRIVLPDGPGKAAMPSWLPGTNKPSSMESPVLEMT